MTLASWALLAVATSPDPTASSGNLVELADDPNKYWDIVDEGVVLVFVEQENCLGCKLLRPYIIEYADRHPDVTVVRLHIDKLIQRSPDDAWNLIAELGLFATPTLILYDNGREVARYVGTFDGDQMEGLEAFVNEGLGGKPAEEAGANANATDTTAIAGSAGGQEAGGASPGAAVQLAGIAGALAAAGLGLAAAFSPCSAPLLAVYTASVGGGGRLQVPREQLLRSNAALLGVIGVGGIGLALLAAFMPTVAGVPVSTVLLLYAGWFLVLWGAYEYTGRAVLTRGLERMSRLLPLLGLECSLPFLLTALAIAATDVTTAAAAAIAFSIGFSLPYILAGSVFATVLRPVARWMGANVKARSLILAVAGAFLIYYGSTLALA